MGEAERDYIRDVYSSRPDLAAEYVEALPETKPIIHRIVPDNAGHLLLAVDIADREPGSSIDVFEDTGHYLGRMTLPSPISLSPVVTPVIHAAGSYLYVVTKDDLDVPYVVRYLNRKSEFETGSASRAAG